MYIRTWLLEVARQQVCTSMVCKCITSSKYMDNCSGMYTVYIHICRLMRRRIKVAYPRIFIYARKWSMNIIMNIQYAVRSVPGIRVVPRIWFISLQIAYTLVSCVY